MKKIVSIIIISLALFLIFKITKIYPRYKYEKENYAALKQKQRNLNSKIISVKKVEIPKTVYGYHRLTTYLFSFRKRFKIYKFHDYAPYKLRFIFVLFLDILIKFIFAGKRLRILLRIKKNSFIE